MPNINELQEKISNLENEISNLENEVNKALEAQKLAEDKKHEAEAKLEKAKEELENENNNCIADLRTQLLEAEQRKEEIYSAMMDALLEGNEELGDALESDYDSATALISELSSELALYL